MKPLTLTTAAIPLRAAHPMDADARGLGSPRRSLISHTVDTHVAELRGKFDRPPIPLLFSTETMKPARVIAAAALLAACAPAMQSATAPSTQRAFVGVWQGMGIQSDQPDSSWSISAAITGGQAGAVVGTIAYPSLTCGGDLVLQHAGADSLVVRERITFGDCLDGGTITFGWRSPGYLDYRWRSATGDVTARGQLGPANR